MTMASNNTIDYASRIWRSLRATVQFLSMLHRNSELIEYVKQQMMGRTNQTLGDYGTELVANTSIGLILPELVANTSTDVTPFHSIEVHMIAMVAGLRPEEIPWPALQLIGTILYVDNFTSGALETLALQLEETVLYTKNLSSVTLGVLVLQLKEPVLYAANLGSVGLGAPIRWAKDSWSWAQTRFDNIITDVLKKVRIILIILTVGGSWYLKPSFSQLTMSLLCVLVLLYLNTINAYIDMIFPGH